MKKSKKRKVILSILLILLVPLAPVLYFFAGTLFWMVGSLAYGAVATAGGWVLESISPNPSAPDRIYGEFPFEIVYELDGQIMTINDVYVCKYDGIKQDSFFDKYREWKGYVKRTGEDYPILLEDGNLKLFCYVGDPEYYMNDPQRSYDEFTPSIHYVIYPNEFGGTSSGVLDIEQYLTRYKLRLISVTLSEPIQNSFD